MKKLTITVGCPGSGKSTWASRQRGALRLERDMFRELLFGSRTAYHNLPAERVPGASLLVGSTMMQAMRVGIKEAGFDRVILSDTGLAWNAVKRFHAEARRFGMEIEVIYFDVSWGILQDRNASRPFQHRVPDEVLKRFYRMQHGMPVGDEVNELWWNDPKKVNRLTMLDHNGEPL
jgi:predicted kinase